MSNVPSTPSITASPTTTKGSTSGPGLPDGKLRKVHASARKMAGYKGESKSIGESSAEILDKLVSSDNPEPPKPMVDKMTGVISQCHAWGFPRRHLRQPKQGIQMDGTWGEKLRALAELRNTGFLVSLLGERWTGKTMMACRLARYHLARDSTFTAQYMRAAEFFIAIKDSYRQDGPSESAQIERFACPDLLVIDELNERSDTRWEDMMLTLLIDKRYGDMKDTLVISNHTPEAFQESVGPSIYRRLVQTGGQVVCDWPSFRETERSAT